jgi:uncharacterized protein YdeI (BOF family)
MNGKRNILMLAPTALLAGGCLFGAGYMLRPPKVAARTEAVAAQQFSVIASAPAPSAAAPAPFATAEPVPVAAAEEKPANPDAAQTYEGIIVSMNGARFVLRDDNNDTWYHLDDQKTAGQHLGKKVVVTGELDRATDVIRIETIADENG